MLNPLPKRKLSAEPVAPTMLPGDRLPILRRPQDELDASQRNPTVGRATFFAWLGTDYLAAYLPGPNRQRGLLKSYRYLTQAECDANNGYGEGFDQLDHSTCCRHTRIFVEHYKPAGSTVERTDVVLVPIYDAAAAPGHRIFVDGSFKYGDQVFPVKWVPADAPEARYGYVRRDTSPPSITDWRVGELSIWKLNGTDQFATLKQAGGPFPAFTGADNAIYTPAAPPAAPYALPAPNHRPSLWLGFSTLTRAELGPNGGEAFEDLRHENCCMETRATIGDYKPTGAASSRPYVVLMPVYEPDPAKATGTVFVDGSFTPGTRIVPVRWVEQDTPDAFTANVPPLDPARTDYPAGFKVSRAYGGITYLFETKQAGGPFSAPPDYLGDAHWRAVAPPLPAAVLAVSYPLSYVRAIVLPGGQVKAGVQYFLPGNWNDSATTQGVEVEGGQGGFARLGTLVAGSTRTPVLVDVAAGTYEQVSQWLPYTSDPTASQPVVQGYAYYQAGYVYKRLGSSVDLGPPGASTGNLSDNTLAAQVAANPGEWELIAGGGGSGGAAPTGPWPPFTNGVVDDAAKAFRATAPAYFRTAELEYTLNAGAAAMVVTEAMRSGDVVSVPNLAGKAAGQVGLRTRTGGGRPGSTWLFNAQAFGAAAFTPYAIQEADAAIRTSGGFASYSSSTAYGGALLYNGTLGAWYELTVPQGCTRVVFEGYKDASSCNSATATVNGDPVGTGSMYVAPNPLRGTYYDFASVAGGDVLRLTNASTNGGGLLIDQISFS